MGEHDLCHVHGFPWDPLEILGERHYRVSAPQAVVGDGWGTHVRAPGQSLVTRFGDKPLFFRDFLSAM
jgi:hypothetical protein